MSFSSRVWCSWVRALLRVSRLTQVFILISAQFLVFVGLHRDKKIYSKREEKSFSMISVTNLVTIPPHGLLQHTTAAHHYTSDYNSHHSLHLRGTHSQLIALIIHCTDHTAAPHHPLYISFGLHLIHCEVLFSPVWHFQAVSLSVSLDCLYDSDRLLPAVWYPLCLPPAPTLALPLLLILPCLRYTCYCLWTLPVWPPLVYQ